MLLSTPIVGFALQFGGTGSIEGGNVNSTESVFPYRESINRKPLTHDYPILLAHPRQMSEAAVGSRAFRQVESPRTTVEC